MDPRMLADACYLSQKPWVVSMGQPSRSTNDPIQLTLSPTAPCAPLYLTALGLICPNKNRADLPEGRELRATAIAALSLRVSLLNNFFLKI